MLAKRLGEMDGDWLTHLEPTISSCNKLDHSALHNNAPKEVMGDDDLRFRLRMENADNHIDNIKQSQTRKQKLEVKGGFRTLNQPLSFKRRTGIPNWSTEVHEIESVDGGTVRDTKGQSFDTRLVLPVAVSSTAPQTFAGGSEPRGNRRRWATGPFLDRMYALVENKGSDGISMTQAAKAMAQKQGFKQALASQIMSFRQFVQLWPEFELAGRGQATRVVIAAPRQRRGPLDLFAQ